MLPGLYSGNGMGGDPDLYITNFAEYAAGAQPADWTSRWVATGFTAQVQAVSGSLSGNALRWTRTVAGRHALSWDAVPLVADCEILVRARAISSWANADTIISSVARGSGSAGAETGYTATLAGFTNSTLYGTTHIKLVGGALTSGASLSGPSPNLAVNDWVWHRYRVAGSALSRKIWHYGAAEPASFAETVTDASITAAGWVGLRDANATPTTEIDFFGVALNGKTVPMPV
jgi:hypothetical protein